MAGHDVSALLHNGLHAGQNALLRASALCQRGGGLLEDAGQVHRDAQLSHGTRTLLLGLNLCGGLPADTPRDPFLHPEDEPHARGAALLHHHGPLEHEPVGQWRWVLRQGGMQYRQDVGLAAVPGHRALVHPRLDGRAACQALLRPHEEHLAHHFDIGHLLWTLARGCGGGALVARDSLRPPCPHCGARFRDSAAHCSPEKEGEARTETIDRHGTGVVGGERANPQTTVFNSRTNSFRSSDSDLTAGDPREGAAHR
mmetsp:Transcript_43091/g.93858  ORF Transcript_43091/g.93858 Transcript_43091/m.93858 type:complete len:256 (+) Transcript_43091:788-1555(+)